MKRRQTLRLVCLALAALCLLTACGKTAAAHADLQKLYDTIVAREGFPEMLPASDNELRNFYGIDPDACPQAIVALCDDGLRVDEIWLLEAGSEDAAKALLSLAESRIQQVCRETENYLPDQYAVAKQSQALRIGSSVALFISPEAQELAASFRQAFSA